MSDCLASAGLQARVSNPSEADYEDCVNTYWSRCAKLKPSCVVRPGSADEISTALKALVRAGQQFAIKCGGHTPWKGSNSSEQFSKFSPTVEVDSRAACLPLLRSFILRCILWNFFDTETFPRKDITNSDSLQSKAASLST